MGLGEHADRPAGPTAGDGNGGQFANLGQRAGTALILGAVATLALYLGTSWFAVFVTAIALVVAWEWGRIVRDGAIDTPYFIHAFSIVAAAIAIVSGSLWLAVGVLAVAAAAAVATQFGKAASLSAVGVFYTGLPSIALLWLRSDEPYGFQAVMFIVCAVVATDVAAYVSGRLIGGAKLWPAVSPKKTWAGLIGGIAASGLTGVLFAVFGSGVSLLWLGGLGLVLGAVAQIGDLGESALKRHFGVKDASGLLPGHGGFMDRMDGVVAAAILAALIGLVIEPFAPARAIIVGS